MIGAVPLSVQIPNRHEHGSFGFATGGSPFFLLNKRADVLSTDRPYNHFGSAVTTANPPVNTYDTSVLVVANSSNCAYLDMYVQAPSTSAPATPAIVKAYGIAIGKGLGRDLGKESPHQLPGRNATTAGTFHPATDFVFNLEDPTTGDISLTFDILTPPVSQPETGASLPANVLNIGGWDQPSLSAFKAFSASKRRTVYCAGADYIIALITQADSRANSCLVGRFAF